MKISVKMFAAAQEAAGQDEVTVELAEGSTVAQLRQQLSQTHPELARLVAKSMFAIDNQYASDETPLSPTHEVACIPPVSGG